MGKNLKPEKWALHKRQYEEWWDGLTHEEKLDAKALFVTQREANFNKRFPFPDMYDVEEIRVNKLSDKQIYRMWCFKDKTDLDYFK